MYVFRDNTFNYFALDIFWNPLVKNCIKSDKNKILKLNSTNVVPNRKSVNLQPSKPKKSHRILLAF